MNGALAELGLNVVFDRDVVSTYERDQAPLAPAGKARALVRARSRDDVVTLLRWANSQGCPVVTRGAGTGLAGGANAVDECVVLDVSAMNRILAIDPEQRLATVEPGVLNVRLFEAAKEQGLFYAPDPASREISSIGGNIATNAGGSCCLKYGVTGDHVAALTVVLADGTVLETGRRTKKNTAGLDLTRLLVGSEGTLGVIVEATVRLLRPPPPQATLVAFYPTLDEAARAIVAMDRADLSLLEVMDQTTVRAVEAITNMGLDTNAAAFVLAQGAVEEIAKIATDAMQVTDDPEEGRLLLRARRMALPALEKLGHVLLDDVAVPKPLLPEMIGRISAIAADTGLTIGTFGHAGDGNLHPTIVFEPAQRALAQSAFDRILAETIALGGTISGEHGIGSLKTNYLEAMLGAPQRALMQRIKAAFDPNNILNPGKAI